MGIPQILTITSVIFDRYKRKFKNTKNLVLHLKLNFHQWPPESEVMQGGSGSWYYSGGVGGQLFFTVK